MQAYLEIDVFTAILLCVSLPMRESFVPADYTNPCSCLCYVGVGLVQPLAPCGADLVRVRGS